MARAKTLTVGRAKPVGDKRVGRGGVPGLVFTRVPKVRRIRSFASSPRAIPRFNELGDFFEERYLVWQARWGGTRPEYIVFDYLERVKKLVHGIDFIFQSNQFGGRTRTGGAVADFELPIKRLIFRVQGERFHLVPNAKAFDIIQKAALARLRMVVVDIWAIPLEQNPSYIIEQALKGIEVAQPLGR